MKRWEQPTVQSTYYRCPMKLKYNSEAEKSVFVDWYAQLSKEAEDLGIPRALWSCYANERVHSWMGSSECNQLLDSEEIDYLTLHFGFVHTDSLEYHPFKVRAVLCANFSGMNWEESLNLIESNKDFTTGMLAANKKDEKVQQLRVKKLHSCVSFQYSCTLHALLLLNYANFFHTTACFRKSTTFLAFPTKKITLMSMSPNFIPFSKIMLE